MDDALWPVAVFLDRYGGIYSGGEWFAVRNLTIDRCRAIYAGPHADDVTAAQFWGSPPDWIAVGDTPELALRNLAAQ